MKSQDAPHYTGITNLEVMREAVNYNRFLTTLVLDQAKAGERIADFGAGAGTFALPVRTAGYNVMCIEPDPVLSEILVSLGLDVCADLEAVPDEGLDYIYSLNVLEHIAEDAATVRLWSRKLRPGGRLLVYVPAFDFLFSSMDRKVGHVRRYRRGTLTGLLEAAGFEIAHCRYVDSLGFPATLAYKLVGDKSGEVNTRALIAYDRLGFPLSRFLDRAIGFFVGKNVYAVAIKSVKHARSTSTA